MKVVVAGGGTAGHVFPALALAERLRADGADITFVGSSQGQEAQFVPAAGFAFRGLRVASAQTRLSFGAANALWLTLRGARIIRSLVSEADVVVGIGGYASAPAILAARRTKTPIVLLEQNSVPGVVNRIASRWADAVAVVFADTARWLHQGVRVEQTGNPVRPEIVQVPANRAGLAAEARDVFGLSEDRRTVVVFGGSQGALHLDQIVAGALPLLRTRKDLQLLVSTGPAHIDLVRSALGEAGDLPVSVHGFIERMDLALALADLAVARAGSGHITELAVCGVPVILVPYPHATENHQEANARELERGGAATVLLDPGLSSKDLVAAILVLMDDDEARAAMGEAIRTWAQPDAVTRLAALVSKVATS
ncbi:MAG: UDP-N-acetylglucosamine--N-acetylmuramyl-(pentapeptide) pyrophosphoryl-undecaprenol [Actinomycetota bacterium]|jgi:UDP-N-acetylglucosamine--N-acetylmuramyl-(pentapeptide) pyrophosphoryl-undecaprenol N-acetylglucosamine transferase|nr:UDP-N-acetylglucosamine--N-acetylmuramyl-(pentapeptide) pyrophosphoryl-undecaprenol [Actinomycetota bacterium]